MNSRPTTGAGGLLLALVLLVSSFTASAQQADPNTMVGDTVTHPVTGQQVTVVAVLPNFAVLTDSNDVILINTNVGDTFIPTGGTTPVTVVSNTIDPVTDLPTQIVIDPNDPVNPPTPPDPLVTMDVARNVDQDVADAIAAAAGTPGDPGGDIPVVIPGGNTNVFARRRVGSTGSTGDNGYGVEICDPTGLLGCATIGYSGTNGRPGTAPSDMIYTITGGNIESVTDGLDGISVVSIGGNGGRGGNSFGNIPGLRGGNAGPGGLVIVDSQVDIATSGDEAHGIFGSSRAGRAGDGGTGFILSSGGGGGTASSGGTVTLTNNAAISTSGEASHGMLAQSMGGPAGSGGDSWGIVGLGGDPGLGGNGGTATVVNNGTIVTAGTRSHGMMSQSVGGTGGDGGDSGGVVALGGGGSAGGNGGTAAATQNTGAQIVTTGNRSNGIFVQSVGGGGGDGGVGGALVALGGSGSAGGSGGTATVTTADGSGITTSGASAHGIQAQSIGGGGGNGATGGGVVALGGSGSGAGNGGSVVVNNGADIVVSGTDSRGIFAQSVGGGGGSANGTGGFVSLGGRGGSGGTGGTVNLGNNGSIVTGGSGGDAIYVQSVGGGGGSGAASGGVVSIGGSGGGAASASTASVNNTGVLITAGDNARGIFAQSIGGGGGSGGASGGLVSIGGSGSQASTGGIVTVVNNGAINTAGINSSAIQAQSIGGGGGDGGTTGGVLLTMGGSSGGGGNASTVTVESNRNLITTGHDANGIFAQSIGGGGGNGGNAASGSLFAGVAIGGSGGAGGDGGTVNVRTNEYQIDVGQGPETFIPLIDTSGDRANGILAQSVGGGGGNGGFAIQASVSTTLSASVGIGGSAGNGGDGGFVDIDSSAVITTAGEDSDGLVAQSVGGGGGTGGFAIAGSIQAGSGASVAVGVGGSGGGGGDGDVVDVDFTGTVQTTGALSEGVIAQSVGGGGGNGGFSIAGGLSVGGAAGAVTVGVGGSGGAGGNAGDVDATVNATIMTDGVDSTGVIIQSIGGGGGNGGYNVSGALAAGVGSGAVNVGVGGSGSSGGNAGVVIGSVDGLVSTNGDRSTGVVMQSVGGGGGNGGFNVTLSGSGAGKGGAAVNVGLGGSGAGGGASNIVTANIAADVITTGEAANAIVLQSIGGGGGNAGINVAASLTGGGLGGAVNVAIGGGGGGGGDGAAVTGNLSGNVQTAGDYSTGILAQSVGGGGGHANVNVGLATARNGVGVSFGLGGAPGDAGDGGIVNVGHVGDILTEGYDATGIHAQSVGGGGGNASFNIATGFLSQGKLEVGIGREGGIGGTGGNVGVSTDGTITTMGDSSIGVLAQSIGGGGGKSGSHSFGVGGGSGSQSLSLGLSLGLEGGLGSTSGNVDVTTVGRIQTMGVDSHAIHAQSIGGGGGIGGMSLLPVFLGSTVGASIGGDGGTGASSGSVTVNNMGELLTLGNDSYGIFAQSIGGGGGNGGIAVTGGLQTGPVGASYLIGGTGGTGAISGDVNVTNAGIIDTRGFRSDGIYAQSLGGGGGNGGMAINGILSVGSASSGLMLGVVVGGEGGSGAAAGDTTVVNTGVVATYGDEANGIFAQSVGGGGGNGGLTANLQQGTSAGGGQIGITIGGTGGTGGTGGNVTVDNLTPFDGSMGGIIFTAGRESHGIHAQSIGGGGGNGSSVLAMNGTRGQGNLQLGVALGGDGGTGGIGGTVTVGNDGMIETQGDGSYGIYAQSIGGGGGNGGLAIAANMVLSATQSASLTPLFVMGGFGGDGEDGGTVTVNNSGGILTSGVAAHGIVAQSIGGGGGNGALSMGINTSTDPTTQALTLAGPLFSALGGTGGDGGLGGDVTVNHTGDITTLGAGSEAIVAESINGGGGRMELDFSGITSIEDQIAAGTDPDYVGTRWEDDDNGNGALWRFDVGAFDRQNSGGGTVIVNSSGTINTLGADSIGQSIAGIGGGGGVLMFRASLADDAAPGSELPLIVRFGGANGVNNNGTDISSAHSGDHLSNGNRAHGALLQSIGGGGGRGIIDLELGSGHGADLGLVLGGRGGTNEAGSAVTYQRDGMLVTTGDHALGTAVQSIGGGGGTAAIQITTIGDLTAPPPVTNTTITIGAESGTGLDGGDINVDLTGDMLTQGTQSHALFVQSIGGGGGLALFSGTGSLFDIALGSSGGAVGNGGTIGLTNIGNLWTEGDMAHGVFLQSIGGGGGAAFIDADDATLNFNLNTAGVGDGGAISFTQTGNISAVGAGSFGIFAQSLGGGGGVVNGLFAGIAGGSGAGGSIDLQIDGHVMAMADGTSAIYAQSDGTDGGGDINISILDDWSIVGGLGGTGISIVGGANNTITNNGLIATLDGLDGMAIDAGSSVARGSTTLFNFGSILGSVYLGTGDNFLRNELDSELMTGANVSLDVERTGVNAVGALINFGVLSPGGTGAAIETVVDGRYVQADSGLFLSELDLSRTSAGVQVDRLTISGSALLAGTIDVSLFNVGYVLPGQHTDVIFGTSGGIGAYEGMAGPTSPLGTIGTTPNIALTGIPASAVASFEITYPNGNDAMLSSNINFAPDALNSNQQALGEHINSIQLAGGTDEFAPVTESIFFIPEMSELADTYNQLSPYVYADALAHSLLSNAQFGERLLSCFDLQGDVSSGNESRCRWLRLSSRDLERDATAEHLGYEGEGIELSGGLEYRMDGGRSLGWGLSYLKGESASFSRAVSESDLFQLGVVYRRPLGRFTFAASGSAGMGMFDTKRRISLPPVVSDIASASPDVTFVSTHGRLVHDMIRERWYLRTSLDIGVNYLHLSSFQEDGGDAVGLEVSSSDDAFISLHPSIEIGGQLNAPSNRFSIRPYGRLGYMALGVGGEPELAAKFAGTQDATASFKFESGLERDYLRLALGIDVLSVGGSIFRLEANGLKGDNTTEYGFEGSWSFLFD